MVGAREMVRAVAAPLDHPEPTSGPIVEASAQMGSSKSRPLPRRAHHLASAYKKWWGGAEAATDDGSCPKAEQSRPTGDGWRGGSIGVRLDRGPLAGPDGREGRGDYGRSP